MDSQLISTAAAACGFFKHHPVYGLPRFRRLSPEWSTWSSVLLTVSCCIKSGLATAQRPPKGGALPLLILHASPCQTDMGRVVVGGHGTVVECVTACSTWEPWLVSSHFFHKLNTLQLSGRPANLDRADTSAARGLRRRGGVSNHFYSVSPKVCVCVCLALHCIASLLADMAVGWGSWAPVAVVTRESAQYSRLVGEKLQLIAEQMQTECERSEK